MARLTDYVGAGARLAPTDGLQLDPARWAWMPKLDGAYARVTLDRRGRVAHVLSRAGAPLAEARDLIGILAGPPDSVLHGELECHTEAGVRAAATRGWANLHLFDATRWHGEDVARRPYTDRYGLLHRAQAVIETEGAGRRNPWVVDDEGDAHDPTTGRYVRPVPHDLRRLPVVPLARGRGAGERLWREHVELGGGEGLVAVRLDAPAAARGAKRKIKDTDTLDCRVLASQGGVLVAEYGGRSFAVRGVAAAGSIVEVAIDGWYETGATPRFPRLVRRRADLAAARASAA